MPRRSNRRGSSNSPSKQSSIDSDSIYTSGKDSSRIFSISSEEGGTTLTSNDKGSITDNSSQSSSLGGTNDYNSSKDESRRGRSVNRRSTVNSQGEVPIPESISVPTNSGRSVPPVGSLSPDSTPRMRHGDKSEQIEI